MELLTVEQAAQRLGVKIPTVRAWIFKERLRKVKLGRAVRIPSDWLEEFIRANTIFEKTRKEKLKGNR